MATTDPIPYDVTERILSRLPAQTLARFRFACKRWRSTILDPKFRYPSLSRHFFSLFNRKKQTIIFLASPPTTEIKGDRFSLQPLGELPFTCLIDDPLVQSAQDEIPLVQSAHGLFMIQNKDRVVIYNPLTRESKLLPELQGHGTAILHYDQSAKEYICIRFRECDPKDPFGNLEGRVIGLEDSEWGELIPEVEDHDEYAGFNPCSSAFLDGFLYLAEPDGNLVRVAPSSRTFQKVYLLPPDVLHDCILFVYEGKLAITTPLMKESSDRRMHTLDTDLSGELVWNPVNFSAGAASDRKKLYDNEKFSITDVGEIVLAKGCIGADMLANIIYYNPRRGDVRVTLAKGSYMQKKVFLDQFGEALPRALLHTNHNDHLMFFDQES